jgi:hypothetical protein
MWHAHDAFDELHETTATSEFSHWHHQGDDSTSIAHCVFGGEHDASAVIAAANSGQR